MASINADTGAVSGITGVTTTADNTGNLALQANGVTLLTVNTANTVSIAGATSFANSASFTGSVNAPNTFGFKNRIINGNIAIDQRNSGANVAISNNTATYTIDRWQTYSNDDGFCSVQQVSDAPSGFVKSLKFITTTADSSLSATQRAILLYKIEGNNTSDFSWGNAAAQTVTLSFWVKSSLTGSFGGAFQNADVNRAYPFSYTINSANTWEQKSIIVPGDTSGTWATDNTQGIRVVWGLGVGSTYSGTANAWTAADINSVTGAVSVIGTLNATWQMTGVQLELGTQATSFDFRSYGTELSLCQRYYEVGGGVTLLVNTGKYQSFFFRVTKRSAATIVNSRSLASAGDKTTYWYQDQNDSSDSVMTYTAASEL